MPSLITLEDARQQFFNLLKPMSQEKVDLYKAGGRVLAEDIFAKENIPPFNRSPLDGYALRAGDTNLATASDPVWLDILEEVPAGHVPSRVVIPGTAIKILTGAPIPEGANAVIKFEDTRYQGQKVAIYHRLSPDANICWAGEDIGQGELGLARGTLITPGAAGMLAALGHGNFLVYKRPKIAILSTGDELVDVDLDLAAGKIRNSNLYSLAVGVEEAGGIPQNYGIVADHKELLKFKLEQALEEADLVITTGGASVGDYDLVKEVFEEINAQILFWRLDIRPGTAAVGAVKEGKALIGLSGNPAAAYITFELLVRPIIRYLGGNSKLYRAIMEGILVESFKKPSPQRRFLRGKVYWVNNGWKVKLTGKQNPGILRSLINSNALIDIPAGTGPLEAGSKVKIIIQGEVGE